MSLVFPSRSGGLALQEGQALVMGVLNITPDSFSDGGQLYSGQKPDLDKILARAGVMLEQGASIIDVGGESTRPGAEPVTEQQEIDRVLPVVERLAVEYGCVISVDSSRPQLMREAAAQGAGLINDVRALQLDGAAEAAADAGLPVCLMHMQGDPGTMQQQPRYGDVVDEVCEFLQARMNAASAAGIDKRKLLLDPGFGFGKTLAHNLQLLKSLGAIVAIGRPVLVGISRKSMLGQILDRSVEDRLAGGVAAATLAAQQGAAIIRSHDVAATLDAIKMVQALRDNVAQPLEA